VLDKRAHAVHVPFLDLHAIHLPLRAEILSALEELIDRNEFVIGPTVDRFEHAFADFCGAAACVGVGSGLDGLRLALIATGLEEGDEVIVPAMTFIATFEAVSQAGGIPVPVDVSPVDNNLDPRAVEAAVSTRTRVVLPVHLYGQLADLRALADLAARSDLALVEDAAQAHGATRDGIAPGSESAAAAFSFYAGKNLGAMGDAGAVTTNDLQLADRVRMLREHGQLTKYRHEAIGWTSRLDAFQAAVLLCKLPHLAGWNDERKQIAAAYTNRLDGVGDLVLPAVPTGSDPVWHLYVIRTAKPDDLAGHLREHAIATGRHYPQPPHLSNAYGDLGYREGSFPVAERLARESLSLPIFPGMSEAQLNAVGDAVEQYFTRG
jgi:dTDP-4-amino-4,6-dideoxygalactose transaminase